MKFSIKQYEICKAATSLFLTQGFEEVSLLDIAKKAQVEEAELFTFFGSKEDIILFLYQQINTDWQLLMEEVSMQKLAVSFEQSILFKMKLVRPYAPILSNMLGPLLQHSQIGVQASRTSHIRSMGLQLMQKMVDQSKDGKALQKKMKDLPSFMYLAHWSILFFYIQTQDEEKTNELISLITRNLKRVSAFPFALRIFPFIQKLGSWSGTLIEGKETFDHRLDREILKVIFNNRKTTHASAACLDNTCENCMNLHEKKVNYFTSQAKPVHFILPAFPAKSPNLNKVLGDVPDLGEEIALRNLEDICKEIENMYPPGAHITICSDGRIFSDLVGVTDDTITQYVDGIKKIILEQNLTHVDIVNLEDLLSGDSFETLREEVLSSYAEPLDGLKQKMKTNQEYQQLFNGMHRFITEDNLAIQTEKSKTKIKKEAKEIALKVIQHSNAWTRFLAHVFPQAIRLSIHPYPAHSEKIGIRLTKAADNWLTPWHGVIVLQEDGYILMKKQQAIEKKAKIMNRKNQPFYYTLISTA